MIGEYTTTQHIKLMKTIHCFSLSEYMEALFVDEMPLSTQAEEFAATAYLAMKRDFFGWICNCSSEGRELLYKYAERKQILYRLTKVK